MKLETPRQQLCLKITAEQTKYRQWLLSLSPEEILNHACEYAMREDIVCLLADNCLTEQETRALLHSPSPLADIYQDRQKREPSHTEDLRDTILHRAECIRAKAAQESER